jgi:cell division inhibitor SepF
MGFTDLWNRTLVYFGIAEDEEWDEDGYQTNEQLEEDYRRRDRKNVRRLPSVQDTGEWASEEASAPPRRERSSRLRSVDAPSPAKVHLVVPRTFNDAKQIADRFKAQIPVILNLQGADTELSKRLIDFASGLTYALDGSMQRVADKVFLLTPRDVELSAEERARAMERGGFFAQAWRGRDRPRSAGFGCSRDRDPALRIREAFELGVSVDATCSSACSRTQDPYLRRAQASSPPACRIILRRHGCRKAWLRGEHASDGRFAPPRRGRRRRVVAAGLRPRVRVDLHPHDLRVRAHVLDPAAVLTDGIVLLSSWTRFVPTSACSGACRPRAARRV